MSANWQPGQAFRVATIPRCGICGRPRVLFMGVCHSCIAKDEELDQ